MKKYLAELIGTFLLVFCGTGAITINETNPGSINHIGISITFGLSVMVVIYGLGKISGAHINPAVTFVFFWKKQLSRTELAGYIISQLSGAFLASIVLRFLFPASEFLGTTLPSGLPIQSFILELILSFILMLTIKLISARAEILSGLVIGAVVGVEAFFAGPLTGASMNPARSIAPALVSGHTEYLWIYILAPFTGMYLGATASNFFVRKTG